MVRESGAVVTGCWSTVEWAGWAVDWAVGSVGTERGDDSLGSLGALLVATAAVR